MLGSAQGIHKKEGYRRKAVNYAASLTISKGGNKIIVAINAIEMIELNLPGNELLNLGTTGTVCYIETFGLEQTKEIDRQPQNE